MNFLNKKKKIGLTFGTFDMFHIGHLNLLKNCKKYCDILLVSVTTDEYIKKFKGRKPIFPWADRCRIVGAIKYVDKIIIPLDEKDDKSIAIKKYKPDVLFVGSDWQPGTYTGEGLGVPVIYLPHTDNISTTSLIESLRI